ncbi:MAG: XamI family restriction endonuclease [Butyrivibrio sp.]|nr:XamI family restriction endonuclease [Ruminococcus flavefaciens]MCM1561195.1 XamI family restriction endonuclease [Butyrivibrio sp.]
MSINRDKPDFWKNDILQSVDLYNKWFMEFAPKAFRDTRMTTVSRVEKALIDTNYLKNISVELLKSHPEVLPILRMSTCPPIARDRLVGLAGISKSLVENMEDAGNPRVSPRMTVERLSGELAKIAYIINKMADPDIFVWLPEKRDPTEQEVQRSATIVADRLCGAVADPIIRNAQEKRQLAAITGFLQNRGYTEANAGTKYNEMTAGTFSFHTNIPVVVAEGAEDKINIPVDVVILPKSSCNGDFPLLIEAKSAGDFTNVNKRRKEEAAKMQQLKNTYGNTVSYSLFLCGYFDSGYLGYEAAEGIDWIWEHRLNDLEQLGI